MAQTDHPDCLECDPQSEETATLSAQEGFSSPAVWKPRFRAGLVWFFTVAAALMIAAEAPLVWVNATVLDTDGWMAATDSLASLPSFAPWQSLLVLVVILVLWLGIIRGIVYLEARPQR